MQGVRYGRPAVFVVDRGQRNTLHNNDGSPAMGVTHLCKGPGGVFGFQDDLSSYFNRFDGMNHKGEQPPSWSDVQTALTRLDRPDPGRGAGWRRLCGALRYGVAAFRRREPEPGCRQGDRSPGNEVPWVHD